MWDWIDLAEIFALRFHVVGSYLLAISVTGDFSPFLTDCSSSPSEENDLGLHLCCLSRKRGQIKCNNLVYKVLECHV